MLLKYFYDTALAHASYLVGCQRAKVAVVVDPGRDIEQYLETAKQENVAIIAVAETHIHADYVSGARELADRVGAKLFVSDEGPAEWKYEYLEGYPHQLLHDGDSFMIGNIRMEVMHTPGHTPESISFLLTDQGGGADVPMGIFTGDFVFVGSIGRPDLLEEAAGIQNTAEPGARDLFRSAQRFCELPDYLQVWPAHGAGSACGKGLGAIPSSTVGYEKRFNPALQFQDEDQFVEYILADQPEAPKYFGVMKRVNKEGPRILGDSAIPPLLSVDELPMTLGAGNLVDLSPSAQFGQSHVPGTLNIPMKMLAQWAGWLLDYDKPTFLIGEPSQLSEATRILHKIGVERVSGFFDSQAVKNSQRATQKYDSRSAEEISQDILSEKVTLVDVRSDAEWSEGHIQQANHIFLGRLPDLLRQIPRDKPVVVQCKSGGRSAIAASVLQAAEFDVINLSGGYMGWLEAALPTSNQAVVLSC